MAIITPDILVINAGSSSLKFALYSVRDALEAVCNGKIEDIGSSAAHFSVHCKNTSLLERSGIATTALDDVIEYLFQWLQKQVDLSLLQAIGHRVVHGMGRTHCVISDELVQELEKMQWLDPEHVSTEIRLIRFLRARFPSLPHVACFDTTFHNSMPVVAQLLPIPRKYFRNGVRRYGFHGLSCEFLLGELKRTEPSIPHRRMIIAHLGSGCSITAIKDGKSIDTSMAFTPAAGIPMSSRSGDIDPGVASYIMQTENINAEQFAKVMNHEAGLRGVSENTGDIQKLISLQHADAHAAEALQFFCYQIRKSIGAFAMALEGIDTLLFSGGIGGNAPDIRSKICTGLNVLGVDIDSAKNAANESVISNGNSKIKVHVIKTNEEYTIAQWMCRILKIASA